MAAMTQGMEEGIRIRLLLPSNNKYLVLALTLKLYSVT